MVRKGYEKSAKARDQGLQGICVFGDQRRSSSERRRRVASPRDPDVTVATMGRQQTVQSLMNSCGRPADRSTSMNCLSPQYGQGALNSRSISRPNVRIRWDSRNRGTHIVLCTSRRRMFIERKYDPSFQ